jgi:hypothetical protein
MRVDDVARPEDLPVEGVGAEGALQQVLVRDESDAASALLVLEGPQLGRGRS